ncbi:hypothetical protein IC621_22275 [Bacillus sp. IB182487]|uniref:Thioesterase domain-containing protein n=1 Tax=Metabacillus arenae TaxID=2771434 RepID=A0A926NKC5_9BACI|nr:hypothetical protein [Metabacillus arenae]
MENAAVRTTILSLIPKESSAVTVEMKLNYLRPSTGFKLTGNGMIINKKVIPL